MKFGIYLPHHVPSVNYPITFEKILEFAEKAEELDFHSVWMGEHMLVAPHTYTRSYLDPMTMLTAIASRTKKVKLGTNVLILPLHQPVRLAKQIATLDFIAPDRFMLGVAVGYNSKEFEAIGVPLNERASRTNEYLEIVKRLLSEQSVTHHGRFYKFKDISIEPLPAKRPPILVGGGSMAPREVGTSAMGMRDWVMAPSLLERIVKYDGWMSRGRSTNKQLASDWEKIKTQARKVGRDPSTLTFVSYSYLHLVETKDHDEALRVQRPLFEELVEDPWEYVQQVYFTGSVEEIIEKIKERERMGVEILFFMPMSLDVSQLSLWDREIFSRFK